MEKDVDRSRPTHKPPGLGLLVDMMLTITQTPGHHAGMTQRLANQVTMTDARRLARTWVCMMLQIERCWACRILGQEGSLCLEGAPHEQLEESTQFQAHMHAQK